MKKILTLLCVFLLCACGTSSLSWEDVKASYEEIETTVPDPLSNETFLKQDYELILDSLKEGVEALTFGIKKDETQIAEDLYRNAVKLEKAASFTDSEYSLKLRTVADKTKKLIAAAFDKTSDYEVLKYEVNLDLDEIGNWEEENWLQVVKKKRLNWSETEEDFLALAEETIESLVSRRKVTEADLELYKDTILNHYEEIANGVSEDTLEVTKQMYASAVALREYTEDLEGNAGPKVYAFAVQTIEYIQEKMGMKTDDPDYDYPAQIESAKKWTLSTLNELTMMMRQ